MRQLYLVNESGSTFFFDERNNTLITDLNGLGIERSNVYLKYSNEYKVADIERNINEISANLIFLKGYEGYTEFINFLRKSTSDIRLFYKSDNLKYCYVAFKGVSKSELTYNSLSCSVKFDKLSHWLNNQNYLITVNENTNKKTYPYKYPYIYSSFFDGEISLTNKGCESTYLRFEILGKTKNPIIELIKDDAVVQVLRIIITNTKDTDKLIIDANPSTQQMIKISDNVETNIYINQDFSCKNFLTLDKGTFIVKFKPGVAEQTRCKISFVEMYEGN